MNKQAIFDKVATHLITQGKQAKDGEYGCMYRGPEGTSCAVGCLISNRKYVPNIEGMNVRGLPDGVLTRDLARNIDLLFDLQGVHDEDSNWVSPKTLKKRLARIAADFKLNTAVLS